ncbi:hypothetical protein [Flaviaesturariibacter terrae]
MLLTEETYKPRKYTALLPLLAPLCMAFFFNGRDWAQQKAIGWITAGCIVASVIIYLLLRAVSVAVTQQGLLFKALPGERLLEWKSLRSVYVHRVWSGRSSQLELVFATGEGGRPATLNTKLYSRRSLQGLASAVLAMAPQAEADEKVRGFAEGRFPWYVR